MLSKEFKEEFHNNNKSGKMASIKFVSKNYPSDFDIINNHIKEDIPFKEKVYLTINGISNVPLCKNPNCNNGVKFRNTTLGYREYCSNRCIGSDPNMIKLKENKSLDKYGTKAPAQSKEIKDKIIETNQKKYGGNSPMNNEKIKSKAKNTLNENWGVDNPSKNKEILNKRVESFKENIDQFKASFKKTNLEKYGVEHHWMVKKIHDKSIKVFYENYEKRITDKLKKNERKYKFISFDLNKNKKIEIKCFNCGEIFNIENYNFYFRANNNYEICTKCNPVGSNYNISQQEIQLLNFIKENYSGDIIENSRSIIPPYEVDIYLPEIKLAIEFNGLYWHSEINKEKEYHFNKTNIAEEKEIQLLHIWEDDWVLKNNIVKSMLNNKFNNTPNKVFARKCKIKEVGSKEYRSFLDNNHIQGYSNSTYSFGLYYNEELVSLMTFSKPRNMMGHKSRDNVYELARFCNKINYNVVGGASKLFKHFMKKYSPKEVYSFSDRSYSNGNLYKTLGFDYAHRSKINYHWVIDKQRKHRYNFAKHKLVEKGYDPNLSEREIMYEQVGAYRIWNSGQDKWIY